MSTLTNEALEALMEECMPSEEQSHDPDLQVLLVPGVLHSLAFVPAKVDEHQEEIHRLLLDLGPAYQQSHSEDDEVHGGGMSFLNMCMTADGEQWTGLHSQQEKLYCLGIASGWATSPLPKLFWTMLPGGMPYFRVEDERRDVSEMLITIREVMQHKAEHTEATEEGDTVTIQTQTCTFCGKGGEVTMPREAWEKYKAGEHIQVAWPQGSAGEREQIINGTHDECFEKAYADMEEED